MILEKYSLGVGDRFGHQGVAQLRSLQLAKEKGVDVVPVWNKSNREHTIIGTEPENTRKEADDAVRKLGWKGSYYVDADHIGVKTVDRFLEWSNFFTLDVADYIGKAADESSVNAFVKSMAKFKGKLQIPGIAKAIEVSDDDLGRIARKYLLAVQEARKTYRYIVGKKGEGNFVTEVSTDEASTPQTPAELFFILAAVA